MANNARKILMRYCMNKVYFMYEIFLNRFNEQTL